MLGDCQRAWRAVKKLVWRCQSAAHLAAEEAQLLAEAGDA
jgi:hypothetical protein